MNKDKFRCFKPPGKITQRSFLADTAGCGYIRIIIPSILLNQFRYKGFQFYSEYSSYFIRDPLHYKNVTFLVFQRSATKLHLEIITHYKERIQKLVKTPVLYESDDLLTGEIPKWNFASSYYKQYKPYIEKMLSLVDGISVSTEQLKKEYNKYNNNIVVIPNHLCKFMWPDPEPRVKETKKLRIVYPCSQNHFSTVKGVLGGDVGETLINFIKNTVDDYEWVFIGGMPQELNNLKDSGKIEQHPWQTIWNYPRFLLNQNADIGIAPLEINDFNKAKSNIKVLEYTAAGIPGIYTDICPYKDVTKKAKNEEEFINMIEEMTNPDLRKEVWEKDYNSVKSQLFWEENENILNYIKGYLKLIKIKLEGV